MPAPPWGEDMDYNLVVKPGAEPSPATALQKQSGRDQHSLVADAGFVNAAKGDYRVRRNSPALKLGFVNFPMDRFGVQKPELKAMARAPALPAPPAAEAAPAASDNPPRDWLGASIRNIVDQGEMSAFGIGRRAVLVREVSPESVLARGGLQKGDVILSLNGAVVNDAQTLAARARILSAGPGFTVGILRNQKEMTLKITT